MDRPRRDRARPASGWLLPLCLALVLLSTPGLGAASVDGRWQLAITGHEAFVYGEAGFGGGVRIPWEVVIEFDVVDGRYGLGYGSARWHEPARPVSRPPGWFDCRQVSGSYLDSNLELHQTPRVRFARYPVAGEVDGQRVVLQPGYRPPGNYLAVTYRCDTANPAADNWFAVAERGKQVLGKRQDAEPLRDGAKQSVRVREVAALPPEGALELPLEDGFSFSQGAADSDRFARYALRRID